MGGRIVLLENGAPDEAQRRGQNVGLVTNAVQCPGHPQKQRCTVGLQPKPAHHPLLVLRDLAREVGLETLTIPTPHSDGLVSKDLKLLLVRECNLNKV